MTPPATIALTVIVPTARAAAAVAELKGKGYAPIRKTKSPLKKWLATTAPFKKLFAATNRLIEAQAVADNEAGMNRYTDNPLNDDTIADKCGCANRHCAACINDNTISKPPSPLVCLP